MKIKKSLKKLSNLFSNLHIQGDKKNVFIFSTPRSGSTWLMEIIATQKGFKFYDEPFNIRRENVQKAGYFTSWDELLEGKSNNELIINYLEKLAKNSLKTMNSPPFRRNYRFFTNRVVFKIHEIEHMINDIKERLNAEIIFLVRHPIANTISRYTYPRLEYFINSEVFSEKYLSKEQLKNIKDIYNNGSDFEKGILSWCYQNLVPLKFLDNKEWTIVTYEENVLNSHKLCKLLFNRQKLNNFDKLIEKVGLPATNIGMSTTDTIDIIIGKNNQRQKTKLITKWKEKVSQNDEKMAFEILSVFELDIYKRESYIAIDKYLNFKDTKEIISEKPYEYQN